MEPQITKIHNNSDDKQIKRGTVLHILLQRQERSDDEMEAYQIMHFKEECSDLLVSKNAIVTEISNNALIAIFVDSRMKNPFLVAADCINGIREALYKYRETSGWNIVLKASINEGEVSILSMKDAKGVLLGEAVNESFLILDTTHPMQVTLTDKVKGKIVKDYNFVPRCPVDLGASKPASLFYLHTPATQPCAL